MQQGMVGLRGTGASMGRTTLVVLATIGGAWPASMETFARQQIQFDNSALQGAYAPVGNGGASQPRPRSASVEIA
jgi:hypothetical protein